MPGRFLKGNKGTEAPQNLVFVDTESYQTKVKAASPRVEHSLRLWFATRVRLENGRVTRRSKAASRKQEDFWAWLDRYSDAHRSTWVFAHNLGFDLTLLGFWKELDRGTFTLQPMFRRDKAGNPTTDRAWTGQLVLDHHVTFAKVRGSDKRYVLVDTCNYWPMSLAAIGESYGLPKLTMPTEAAAELDWLAYCERDVEIIERSVIDLISRWTSEKCGVFKTTAASLAFTSWRHTCDVRRPDGETLDVVTYAGAPEHTMERDSYFGGRTQVYSVGPIDGPIYHVDVNSLYPAMMRNNTFPRRYIRSEHATGTETLAGRIGVYGCVASVFIKSRWNTYPVRIDGRQYHCNGQFWTTLAGPELARAISLQDIYRVGTVQYYSVARLFRGWVDYWHGRKLAAIRCGASRRAEREFCNLILKSLSGKFAQYGRRWEFVPGKVALERWGGWSERGHSVTDLRCDVRHRIGGAIASEEAGEKIWRQHRGIAGHTQILDDSGEPDHAFPLISSYITSYAREFMYDVIHKIGQENVYYMATDSLLVNQLGYDLLTLNGLMHPTELGKFKLAGKHEYGEVIGINHYSLDGKVTVAGWEAKAKPGVGGIRVCDVWERLPSIVSKGPIDTVTVSTLPTGRYRPDHKGRVDRSGRWIPFRLSDDPDFTDKPPRGGYTDDDLTRLTCVGVD